MYLPAWLDPPQANHSDIHQGLHKVRECESKKFRRTTTPGKMMSYRAMFKMKVILFLSILHAVKIDATVNILSRSEQTHPDWQFGYRITSFEDGRLLYSLCDNGNDKKTCMIIQENLLTGTMIYTCNVTLIPEQKNARPGKFFARSFGDDKSIFVWEEKGAETYVKFVTTKLSSCQSNEAKILDSGKMQMTEPIAYQLYTSLKIAVYEEHYDVFFKDVKRCGNRECKISIDSDGVVVDELASQVSTTRYQMVIVMQPIAKRAVDMGFVCVKINWNRSYFSFLRPNGKEKPLARMDNDNQITGVLVEHEIVGICTSAEREFKITCSQYNRDGNVKLKAVLTEISPETHMIAAHILREGGFLLMFYRTEKCQHSNDCMSVARYWIVKVDVTGEVGSHVKFHGFEATSIVQHIGFVYENPNGEGHCATIVFSEYDAMSGKKRANNRHVVTNCFDEDDFVD